MDKQNKKITELTPEQMDKVSGGSTDDERFFKCKKCMKAFPIELYSSHTKTCKGYEVSPTQPDPVPEPIQSK